MQNNLKKLATKKKMNLLLCICAVRSKFNLQEIILYICKAIANLLQAVIGHKNNITCLKLGWIKVEESCDFRQKYYILAVAVEGIQKCTASLMAFGWALRSGGTGHNPVTDISEASVLFTFNNMEMT
ncbi:hypothetical protein ACJX0J_040991, partial [Zea mays]